MEDQSGLIGTVDPEVRAYVTSLVTAVGGPGSYDDGRYLLGDDALACLKDIKRWLKLYDEKLNRLDVARVLAERNIVKGDLLEILASWPESETDNKLKSKIALACLELLVPLTWPIEGSELQSTANYLRNAPYLELAQINYKREILDHASTNILQTALRIGIPSLALPAGERTQRDEGIIKLLLYFYRNVAIISAPQNLPVEWNENEVSRSATIESFAKQDVFDLLLTVSSNMGEDFNTQDVIVLELLFHILKGVEVEQIFVKDEDIEMKHSRNLKNLMTTEAALHRSYKKEAPTRHHRFGTMIWVKRDDEKVSSVSGQDVLRNSQRTMEKMDQSKRWNKPRQRRKDEQTQNHFDKKTSLTNVAARSLKTFVCEFLDSGFNPLMQHLRKAIEREADRILMAHTHQYFYVLAWFLEAERTRRHTETSQLKDNPQSNVGPPETFGVVASVLNQETFVLLNRYIQERLDHKIWHEVNSGMRAFTQILLTVQSMAESPLEDDQEIAENIQNRIFYEETTHDRILFILRTYKDQGFGYLDGCTELSHVFLRMLERYSKENGDLQIRSRRKARQKRKASSRKSEAEEPAELDSEAEDIAEAQRISRERKFDLNRFASKFVNQHCVDTFVHFLTYYRDLNKEQLKRAHRFFYRVAFKQEMSVMLFRMDILALFHRMIKGPEPLATSTSTFNEWDELVRQIFRRMVKKLQTRPELAVEMLFSKISSTAFYLEYGYEKQTTSAKPRAPAELEVKGSLSWEEQISVVVAILHDDFMDAIFWVKRSLESALEERKSWEAEAQARRADSSTAEGEQEIVNASITVISPDNDERRIQIFKNSKLRLLMVLCHMERIGDDEPDASWVIPSNLASEELQHTIETLEKYRLNPIFIYGEDGTTAEDMLRRKSQSVGRTARAEFDDDSDGLGDFMEEEFLFPLGPKPSSRPAALDELKKKRRKRRGSEDEPEPLDEETLRERRRQRLLKDLEKRRKIKSSEFVHDSDDEDPENDGEFFVQEELRRKRQATKVADALRNEGEAGSESRKRKTIDDYDDEPNPKRNRPSDDEGSLDFESENEGDNGARSSSPRRAMDSDASVDDDEENNTPLSSQSEPGKTASNALGPVHLNELFNRTNLKHKDFDMVSEENDHNKESPETFGVRRRARVILDDSDDE